MIIIDQLGRLNVEILLLLLRNFVGPLILGGQAAVEITTV